MKKYLLAISVFIGFAGFAQKEDLAFLYASKLYNDTADYTEVKGIKPSSFIKPDFANFNLYQVLSANQPARKILGYSKQKAPIEFFYFPGTSSKKALVIGGVHGSELSAIEVAKKLIADLSNGPKPYYSVVIIPVLFPDNAANAAGCKSRRVEKNAGRYSHEKAIDPNRQFPILGGAFNADEPVDAYGRTIEEENQLLLQLIQAYGPQRIANLHAIKGYARAGIYADPRTDCSGKALGFSSDSALAVQMAKHIDENGGNAFGNEIKTKPSALYYLDPKPAQTGEQQQRNLVGANMQGKINGVSLGGWASTAVCDKKNNYSRPAMRILTVEFPGYKKPSEYLSADDKQWYEEQLNLYAASIRSYFLQAFYVEETESQNDMATNW